MRAIGSASQAILRVLETFNAVLRSRLFEIEQPYAGIGQFQRSRLQCSRMKALCFQSHRHDFALASVLLQLRAMDIARPDIKQKKKRQMLLWAGAAVIVVVVLAAIVLRLKPAAPTVDRSTIWTDTVKRGPLVRQVRSTIGVLAPREDSIELIPAQTDATVVRIRILPGAQVTPDTIIMDLVDPELQQEVLNAQLALKAAQADYKSFQATLQSTLMDKKTAAAQVNADYTQDQLQAQTDKALYDLGVISGLTYQKSKSTADQLTAQHDLSQQQLDVNEKAMVV
jgi:HlyD family secretion protein